jgi:hypothetical protein
MFTECLLNVHCMLTECSLNVHSGIAAVQSMKAVALQKEDFRRRRLEEELGVIVMRADAPVSQQIVNKS